MTDFLEQVRRRRTFAIISHPDAGKTTLTEKLLLYGGAIHIAGSVKARKASRHATSDWMEIEKQRGISVASSVMQFEYREAVVNLLDTPGHRDFSEDTYRVLTAVDSALMVIDAANGVEPQTKRLIQVCRQRDHPIITFVNKMDREGIDPIDLLDEIERELGMPCVPMTWPVGQGRAFAGILDLRTQSMRVFEAGEDRVQKSAEGEVTIPLSDVATLTARFGDDYVRAKEAMELATGATGEFNLQDFLDAKVTPVFFGSAVNNFGIQEVLDALVDFAPPPRPRSSTNKDGSATPIAPQGEGFSGVVFKVQANMDPMHRDRIAFLRVCSGRFTSGMKLKLQRTGKEMRPTSVVTFMSQRREQVDEAFAGDIIGFTIHGGVQLGDTITEGAPLQFTGLPFFAPELFQTVELTNPMKSKQLQQGLQQLGEEGAIQVFKPQVGTLMLLGAVGQLQFEVVQHRLSTEYKAEIRLLGCKYVGARWVTCDDATEMRRFQEINASKLAVDAAGTLAYLLTSTYDLELTQERHPKVKFHPLREHAGLQLDRAA